MSTSPKLLALPAERDRAILRFLIDAPLGVPTRTIARAFFGGTKGTTSTQEKRAWRRLRVLEASGLVGSTTIPTRLGRSPACWHPHTAAFAALAGYPEGIGITRKSVRTHDSRGRIANRRHEGLVQFVKADLVGYGRANSRVESIALVHDQSVWWSVDGARPAVAPDLVAVLGVPGGRGVIFIEVQGTASPLRIVSERTADYLHYVATGAAAARYGSGTTFRLVWLTFTDDPRGEEAIDHGVNILEAASEVPNAGRLTMVAPMSRFERIGFAGPTLWRADDFQKLRADHPESFSGLRTRHAGNAIREKRDGLIRTALPLRRWFE